MLRSSFICPESAASNQLVATILRASSLKGASVRNLGGGTPFTMLSKGESVSERTHYAPKGDSVANLQGRI